MPGSGDETIKAEHGLQRGSLRFSHSLVGLYPVNLHSAEIVPLENDLLRWLGGGERYEGAAMSFALSLTWIRSLPSLSSSVTLFHTLRGKKASGNRRFGWFCKE